MIVLSGRKVEVQRHVIAAEGATAQADAAQVHNGRRVPALAGMLSALSRDRPTGLVAIVAGDIAARGNPHQRLRIDVQLVAVDFAMGAAMAG